MSPKRRSPLRDLALLAASLVVCYAAAEIAFRLWFGIGFTHMPYVYHLNSLDFRGREPARDKSVGTVRRVMILGDSYAYGFGVAEPDILASRVEKDAPAAGLGVVEVLNFSRMGLNTCAEADLFLTTGKDFDFDDLVLAFTFNDIELAPLRVANQQLLCAFTQLTLLHSLVFEFYTVKQRLLGGGKSYEETLKGWYRDKQSPEWRKMTACILALNSYCLAQGKRFFMLLFEAYEADRQSLRRVVFEEMSRFAQENGIRFLSIPEQPADKLASLRVHRFDAHPDRELHAMAATALIEGLAGK